jgi:UDP-3-O-[3-hydroxymyristoyl] glucosamine N-acyltransferase
MVFSTSMELQITLQQIVDAFPDLNLTLLQEDSRNIQIQAISAIETAGPGCLVFLDKPDFLPFVEERKPTAVVTSKKFQEQIAQMGSAVILANNVSLAHAKLKQKYASRDFSKSGWTNNHSSCVIHPSAEIDPSVVLEPGVVIGAEVKIAADCRIMANTVIENGVSIQSKTIIHPNVVIGYNCQIGSEVVIESGSVIGSEGFGFAQDQARKSHTIPQTGIVVIEDRVRVGANCCIDRAAYGETRIGSGTKFDNLCHVAHNVQIGKDCLLTAMFVVAGSSKIGDRVIASGATGIIDHINVCNDVVLLHRAGVTKDVDKPGAYAGLPLQPMTDYMKNTSAMKSLNEMRKRLIALEKHLGIVSE